MQFLNGEKHGQGKFSWVNGDQYTGEWKNSSRTGRGTYFYANGDEYTGEFLNGKKHGQGTYKWANGDQYTGEWKNDKQIDLYENRRNYGETIKFKKNSILNILFD